MNHSPTDRPFARFTSGLLPVAGVLLMMTGGMANGLRAQTPPAAVATSPAPEPTVAATPPATVTVAAEPQKGELLAVAKAAGNFQTFLKAVDTAGLTGTLQKPGPYTVFAPTDAAFAKLPAGTLDNLLKPENKPQLIALLSYHIVTGKYAAADLAKVDEIKSLEGTEVDIETSSDGKVIEVDEGKIVGGAMEASNGMIHPLDTVLQP